MGVAAARGSVMSVEGTRGVMRGRERGRCARGRRLSDGRVDAT